MKKKRFLWYLGGLVALVFGIVLDQWTKFLANTYLKGKEDIVLIKNVFCLHYLENRGAAFGIFQGQKTFFIITTLLLLSAALYFYIRLPYTKRFAAFRICILSLVHVSESFQRCISFPLAVDPSIRFLR